LLFLHPDSVWMHILSLNDHGHIFLRELVIYAPWKCTTSLLAIIRVLPVWKHAEYCRAVA